MTESPGNLTVRVVMKPIPLTRPSFRERYHWDRILFVAALLGALGLGLYWLLGPAPESAEERPGMATEPPAGGSLASRGSENGEADPGLADAGDTVANDLTTRGASPAAGRQGDLLDYARRGGVAEPRAAGERNREPVDSRAAAAGQFPARSSPGVAQAPEAAPAPENPLPAEPAPIRENPLPEASAPTVAARAREPQPAVSVDDPGLAGGLSPLATLGTKILSPRVTRFVITDAVVAREPVGNISDIRSDEGNPGLVRVFAFSAVRDLNGQTIRYRWQRGGKIYADVPVQVSSAGWRSYSSKYLSNDMRGRWRVELIAADDQVLAFTEFEY
jgi:hypothetical protein